MERSLRIIEFEDVLYWMQNDGSEMEYVQIVHISS